MLNRSRSFWTATFAELYTVIPVLLSLSSVIASSQDNISNLALDGPIISGFSVSLYTILISELGDKTFFIAAVMSMQYPRLLVYAGAISALGFMTVLSVSEEYEEVKNQFASPAVDVEANLKGFEPSGRIPLRNIIRHIFPPVFIEAFVLTFLAEWGDRSQLTTIVIAVAKSPVGVILGGILGHMICTGIAVVIGSLIAQRIPVKILNYIGAMTFILFALATFIGSPDSNS